MFGKRNMCNFERDLAAEFGQEMRESNSLCMDIWAALVNVKWRRCDTIYSCTFRYAGSLIAEIINKGDYMDWYCSKEAGVVTNEIAERMKARGWQHYDYEDEHVEC